MLAILAKWGTFSVAFSLVPLGASWLIQVTHNQSPTWETLLSHGELLLITVALSTAAVGELIGSGRSLLAGKYIAGGASLLIAVVCAIYFADIAASYAGIREAAHAIAQQPPQAGVSAPIVNQSELDISIIMLVSLIAYGGALVTSGCCIALSEA